MDPKRDMKNFEKVGKFPVFYEIRKITMQFMLQLAKFELELLQKSSTDILAICLWQLIFEIIGFSSTIVTWIDPRSQKFNLSVCQQRYRF